VNWQLGEQSSLYFGGKFRIIVFLFLMINRGIRKMVCLRNTNRIPTRHLCAGWALKKEGRHHLKTSRLFSVFFWQLVEGTSGRGIPEHWYYSRCQSQINVSVRLRSYLPHGLSEFNSKHPNLAKRQLAAHAVLLKRLPTIVYSPCGRKLINYCFWRKTTNPTPLPNESNNVHASM